MADPFALMNRSLNRQVRTNATSARRKKIRDPNNPEDAAYLRAMHPDFDELMVQGNIDYKTRCHTDAKFANKFALPPILEPTRVFREHNNSVDAVCWGPEPGSFLSASHDATLKLWNAAKGEVTQTLRGHSAGVYHCAISSNKKTIISCGSGETGNVIMWSLPAGKVVRKLTTHRRSVVHAVFSSDDRLIATTDVEGTVAVHDVGTGSCTLRKTMHFGTAHGSSFCREDPNLLVTAGNDGDMHLINLRDASNPPVWLSPSVTANCVSLLAYPGARAAHDGHAVYAVEFTDRTTVFSGGADHKLKRWDLRSASWSCVGEYLGHTAPIRSLAVSLDQRFALTGCEDGSLRIWPKDAVSAAKTATRALRKELVAVQDKLKDGAAGYPAGDLDRRKAELQGRTAEARAVEERLLRGGYTPAVKALTGHVALVSGCAWREDGNAVSILSSSWDQKVQLYNFNLSDLA